MIVAAIQIAGVVKRLRIEKAMAWLEETFQLGELLAGTIVLERHYHCVIAGLSQSHVLGFITTVEKILIEVSCSNHWALKF